MAQKTYPHIMLGKPIVRSIDYEKTVTVCDRCFMASCWQGHHRCQDSDEAGTKQITIAEARELNREHPDYWNNEQ